MRLSTPLQLVWPSGCGFNSQALHDMVELLPAVTVDADFHEVACVFAHGGSVQL